MLRSGRVNNYCFFPGRSSRAYAEKPDEKIMSIKESEQEKYYELAYYTLSHPDPAFIHQHAVDAFTAQNANAGSKPISITFALIGLYL